LAQANKAEACPEPGEGRTWRSRGNFLHLLLIMEHKNLFCVLRFTEKFRNTSKILSRILRELQNFSHPSEFCEYRAFG
jgi:hypothetical protein